MDRESRPSEGRRQARPCNTTWQWRWRIQGGAQAQAGDDGGMVPGRAEKIQRRKRAVCRGRQSWRPNGVRWCRPRQGSTVPRARRRAPAATARSGWPPGSTTRRDSRPDDRFENASADPGPYAQDGSHGGFAGAKYCANEQYLHGLENPFGKQGGANAKIKCANPVGNVDMIHLPYRSGN